MRRVVQISIELNANSVGKIAEQIGEAAIAQGWESYITYARDHLPSKSKPIKIGNTFDIYYHVAMTRLFDRHCLCSTHATKKLIKTINEIKPDIIHLHHIHGYYINMNILFEYLKNSDIPVVWTFHDCWSFTGHCAHPEDCNKWKTGCHDCIKRNQYPASLFVDRSRVSWIQKKQLFSSVDSMTIVTPSNWIAHLAKQSFLNKYPIRVLPNGIDTDVFSPKRNLDDVRHRYNISCDKKILLGVASTWSKSKGLDDFIELSNILSKEYQIVLVGLNDVQLKNLPANIIGIKRTHDVNELATLYSLANVFVNPTYADTFPTTNLEALACGTPVITYRTGGSPEAIDPETGIVVEQGDTSGLIEAIKHINNHTNISVHCRQRALNLFDKRKNFNEYINIYNSMLK